MLFWTASFETNKQKSEAKKKKVMEIKIICKCKSDRTDFKICTLFSNRRRILHQNS